jgi:hypothetical protein
MYTVLGDTTLWLQIKNVFITSIENQINKSNDSSHLRSFNAFKHLYVYLHNVFEERQ